MKRALVLSGGGARGAYQIGVWKALRELNIKYDIITGTSVGALNGALILQNNYEFAENLWNNINFKDVFKDKFFHDSNSTKNTFKVIRKYVRAAIMKNGLEIDMLEDKVKNHLSEEMFCRSDVNYGLVAYDIDNKSPLMLTKGDMPKGKLNDFIIASATLYPVFRKKEIDGKYYVDGGYYDNLPINLAADMGAEDVIAVHIGVFGKLKSVRDKNIKITYIKPKSKLGSPFIFNSASSQRGLRLGYNDTMKLYGEYEGNLYTFKKNNIINCYNKYKTATNSLLNSIFRYKTISRTMSDLREYYLKHGFGLTDFQTSIELLGYLFKVDESHIYNIDEFTEIVLNNFRQFNNQSKKNIFHKIKSIILHNRKLIACHIYERLKSMNDYNLNIKIRLLSLLYPRVFIGSLYLYTVSNINNKYS